ncbi:fungal-specific transcription factor domain-containing protein [Xylariomycetidae sp. FL2044]|nr:fungal-specific transcription factor domain-containing protein [Xylariomycetidae sp. FL2044]
MSRRPRNDIRTRTGCQKCRERRVKCPEQRPICRHCERLGFACTYELRLCWQTPMNRSHHDFVPRSSSSNSSSSSCADSTQHTVLPWMFINLIDDDFDHGDDQSRRQSSLATWERHQNTPQQPPSLPDIARFSHVSPYYFSSAESYLWDYFFHGMTPKCVLDQGYNPYRGVIMRLALASPGGPLFHCILAVAANQLNTLGHSEYISAMWQHRARALGRLRGEVTRLCDHDRMPDPSIDSEQVLACALMMCFFEIMQDCSETWVIHAKFSTTYLCSRAKSSSSFSAEEQDLYDFITAYFVSHDILASTAWSSTPEMRTVTNDLCKFADANVIQTLTGCSKDLLTLISEINSLGSLLGSSGDPKRPACTLTEEQQLWRDSIERRLHQLQRLGDVPSHSNEDMQRIAEVKRLATLLYLHARIDHSSPQEPHMTRVTAQILTLLPQVSLRTNTVLWPLFIVATLGTRQESDEDRLFILSTLAALQSTRQLGNVRKARQVIESVWTARDLKTTNANKGWEILRDRHRSISLA